MGETEATRQPGEEEPAAKAGRDEKTESTSASGTQAGTNEDPIKWVGGPGAKASTDETAGTEDDGIKWVG